MKVLWTSCLLALAATTATALKTPADFLQENGYPSEVYVVNTTDGYFLRLDRIPNPKGPPVFLANSLFSSGTIFLHLGPGHGVTPGQGLAYALYDAGYDVFIGNDRSTAYSQDFTQKYNKENSPRFDKYFLFSFHEHGVLDDPAFIRKVLEVTGHDNLTFVGYSMGTTGYLVMASTVPEMTSLVRSAHLMGPAMSLGQPSGNAYKLLHPTHNATRELLDIIGVHKFDDKDVRNLVSTLCPNQESGFICNEILSFLFNAPQDVDYVGNCQYLPETEPAGGSLPEALHFAQNTNYPGRFKQYDDGPLNNLLRYGSVIPPDYEFKNIKIPTYTYTGKGDVFVTKESVAERGVALIKSYNRLLTNDEEQLQFLLRVVEYHRKSFPDSKKGAILISVTGSTL